VDTRVLVVESDAAFADALRRALAPLGCAVAVCNDGEAGLAHAEAHRPDLILVSVELKGMNGFAVCNRLKRHAALKSVPLVVMSSECDEETFEQHRKLRAHADDYVRKPISIEQLLPRMVKLVPGLREAVSSSAAYRAPTDDVVPIAAVDNDRSTLEEALARAIDRASAAGRWDVVTQLARELEARRKS